MQPDKPMVRVKDKMTGHEYTISAEAAKDEDRYQILDKPALNSNSETSYPKYSVLKPASKTTSTTEKKA